MSFINHLVFFAASGASNPEAFLMLLQPCNAYAAGAAPAAG
jgi:hypothetical protein